MLYSYNIISFSPYSQCLITNLFRPISSFFSGGGKEVRTPDPLLAKQVLSQLSYTPDKVVGLGRLELPTSRLSGVRSNHLSYKPLNLPPDIKEDTWTASNLQLFLFL